MHTQTASNSTPEPVNSPTTSTRDRLLDVAERLFAERGVDATSLRAITTEAEANLASVNYHFGSKDGLFLEILARRTAPVNAERLRLLSLAEKQADGHPMRAHTTRLSGLRSACMPATERCKHIISLLGRLHTEPRADELKRLFFNELRE